MATVVERWTFKSEARNPKFETNSNVAEIQKVKCFLLEIGTFGFWICFEFRYSNFEFIYH